MSYFELVRRQRGLQCWGMTRRMAGRAVVLPATDLPARVQQTNIKPSLTPHLGKGEGGKRCKMKCRSDSQCSGGGKEHDWYQSQECKHVFPRKRYRFAEETSSGVGEGVIFSPFALILFHLHLFGSICWLFRSQFSRFSQRIHLFVFCRYVVYQLQFVPW